MCRQQDWLSLLVPLLPRTGEEAQLAHEWRWWMMMTTWFIWMSIHSCIILINDVLSSLSLSSSISPSVSSLSSLSSSLWCAVGRCSGCATLLLPDYSFDVTERSKMVLPVLFPRHYQSYTKQITICKCQALMSSFSSSSLFGVAWSHACCYCYVWSSGSGLYMLIQYLGLCSIG